MSDITRPGRPLLVAAIVVAALVVAAVVAVLLRPTPTLDPATPEGTVQRYTALVIDGDQDGARAMLTPARVADCIELEPWDVDRLRATLVDSVVNQERAMVRVELSSADSGFLGRFDFSWQEEFMLERIDGQWRVASAPWRLAVCEEVDR